MSEKGLETGPLLCRSLYDEGSMICPRIALDAESCAEVCEAKGESTVPSDVLNRDEILDRTTSMVITTTHAPVVATGEKPRGYE